MLNNCYVMNMDSKDRAILYWLDHDARASLGQIARRTRLSKQVVDYRIKRLEKEGVIRCYYSVINFSPLGYTQYKLYIKLTSAMHESKCIEHWKKSSNTIWVASCRGHWDITVSILAKNAKEIGNIIDDFMQKHSLNIQEKDILITQRSPVFTRSYLAATKEKKEFVYTAGAEEYTPDSTEHTLLLYLAEHARDSILDIMKSTGLTRDIIHYRIRKLQKQSMISQYRVNIDLAKIGLKLYKVLIKLQSASPARESSLMQFVKHHTYGTQFLRILGAWDIELEFEVPDEEALYHIIDEIRSKYADIIGDYDVLWVHKDYKLNYYPFTIPL